MVHRDLSWWGWLWQLPHIPVLCRPGLDRMEQHCRSTIILWRAAYWFTASTSFANPAVTIARSLSDTFAGIRPSDVPLFIVAQIAGALCATLLFRWLVPNLSAYAGQVVVPHTSALDSL